MQTPEFHFHPPSIIKRVGERIGACQITPADIVPENELDRLYKTYRDLGGDPNLGVGNDGYCQDWQGYRYWWKEFLERPSQYHSSFNLIK